MMGHLGRNLAKYFAEVPEVVARIMAAAWALMAASTDDMATARAGSIGGAA